MADYVELARRGVVVFDGATGTYLQALELGADDFGGPALEGCNEMLNVTRPDVVSRMHLDYLDAGADVVETNTFGSMGVPLGEYGLTDRSYELSAAAAALARQAVDQVQGADPGRPRWVAGSVGPGTKSVILGHIRYPELRDHYEVQSRGLLDGGADL